MCWVEAVVDSVVDNVDQKTTWLVARTVVAVVIETEISKDEMLLSINCLAVKVGWILFRLLNIFPTLAVNSVSLQLMALR